MVRSRAIQALRDELTETLRSIEDELGRANTLLADASSSLVHSFGQMKDQIEVQSAALATAANNLVLYPPRADSSEAPAAVEEMTRLVERLFNEVVHVCTGAKTLVESFDSVAGHVRDIGLRVQGIDRVTRQMRFVALNANIEARQVGESAATFLLVADEVKDLADRSARITEQVHAGVRAARSSAEEARATINRFAGENTGSATDLRRRVAQALSALEALDLKANETMQLVSDYASRAITTLQVEDQVRTLLASTAEKLNLLGAIGLDILGQVDDRDGDG